MIDQQHEAERAADVRIAQKVNAAHREAFQEKFPGQCEHIMRLVAERLQHSLRKDQPVITCARDIESLAHALNLIYQIHAEL